MINALKEREQSITEALEAADRAKEEMANLVADNEQLLIEAKDEKNNILKEAKEAKDKIVNEAKDQAKVEAAVIVSDAKREIDNQKNAAIAEVKNHVGALALEIAEKILRKKFESDDEQQKYIVELVDDLN